MVSCNAFSENGQSFVGLTVEMHLGEQQPRHTSIAMQMPSIGITLTGNWPKKNKKPNHH